MYIKRNLEGTILKYLDYPEIIAVVGARQAGKTTMISRIINGLDKTAAVSFDDQNTLNLFEKETEDFIKSYVKGNKYLFIDEFQYAKNGGKILKYIFDTQKIKIIISGSSAIDLTIRALRYLVGRVLIFNLYPFNFNEFLLAKDKDLLKLFQGYQEQVRKFSGNKIKISKIIHNKLLEHYEEYLLFGGYPRAVLADGPEAKKEILRNIYNTYFLREVRDILGLIDDYKLNNLIQGLALQTGNLIDYSELGRLSDCSFPTVKRYLNFLEKTYVCGFVRPFFKNKRTEIVKNPKVYFLDTGLRNFAADDFRKLDKRLDKGALLENGLVQQFIKEEYKFNFWRDKKGNEIDFILSLGDGKTVALESKSYLKNINVKSAAVFNKLYPDLELYYSYQNISVSLNNIDRIYPVYLY